MNIGTAAKRSGVSPKAIRYYESIGLIPSAARAANDYRVYSETDVHFLRFIHRARRLGFTVHEAGRLLALWSDRQRASADVKALVLTRLSEIDRKVAQLEGLKQALVDLMDGCRDSPWPDYPTIDEPAVENVDRPLPARRPLAHERATAHQVSGATRHG
jgi:MerR family copper efflux transcriptional regulator